MYISLNAHFRPVWTPQRRVYTVASWGELRTRVQWVLYSTLLYSAYSYIYTPCHNHYIHVAMHVHVLHICMRFYVYMQLCLWIRHPLPEC